jgi:hypothetical protein
MLSGCNRSLVRLAGLGVLLAAGCGVDEYEKKMVEAQTRAKRFDEESAVLGAPIVVPSPPDKDGSQRPIANFFLRLPKGIRTTAEKDNEAQFLYTYPSTGSASGPFVEVQVAVGDQKDFAVDVKRRFPAKEINSQKRQMTNPLHQQPTTFDTTELEDAQYFYSINIYRDEKKQIAIVYKVASQQRETAAKTIRKSLESFAVDQEAKRLRELDKKGSPLQVPGHPTP